MEKKSKKLLISLDNSLYADSAEKIPIEIIVNKSNNLEEISFKLKIDKISSFFKDLDTLNSQFTEQINNCKNEIFSRAHPNIFYRTPFVTFSR